MEAKPVSFLLAAYDAWVREETPSPTAARSALHALQQALHESHRRGGRLASVPLLLAQGAGRSETVAPLMLLPPLSPNALLIS